MTTTLDLLVGAWAGEGVARFPTIETAPYFEEIVVEKSPNEPHYHYEQNTWRHNSAGGKGEFLHWESGFIQILESGGLQMLNAQNSGRVEVLFGKIEKGDGENGALSLTFEKELIGNDERIITARRRYVLQRKKLSYTVEMATTEAPELQLHLDAVLERS